MITDVRAKEAKEDIPSQAEEAQDKDDEIKQRAESQNKNPRVKRKKTAFQERHDFPRDTRYVQIWND